MQKLLDKLFPNISSEEQWTELIALSAPFALALFMGALGFMLGPVFMGTANDISEPLKGHASLPGAAIGAVAGLVIGLTLWTIRRSAIKAEAEAEAHGHDHHDDHAH